MNLPHPIGCRWCGEAMILVRTPSGRNMPLDAEPNEAGNVTVFIEDDRLRAHVHKKGVPEPIGTRFMPHFATCANYGKRTRR